MPLNEALFAALESRFGKGNVRVNRPGQKLIPEFISVRDEDNQPRLQFRRKTTGEEYVVKCFRCRDYKPRLSISYCWGVREPRTGSRRLGLIQCWNADCFKDYEVIKKFYEELMGDGELLEAEPVEERGMLVKKSVEMPGKLWRIDRLAEKVPRHAAVLYAQERMLSIQSLGEEYGVGYCPEPWVSEAANRLIVPVRMKGKLVGWSGRYLGKSDDKRVPKWYHVPGMEKAELWYNFDVARTFHTKILVEGSGDVWGIGRCGLGALGNRISPVQLDLLSEACEGDDFAIVLMLDPLQADKDIQLKKTHHLEKAYEQLREVKRFENKIVKVYLSRDLDPGDADRGYMYSLIRHCARQQGVKVVLPEI